MKSPIKPKKPSKNQSPPEMEIDVFKDLLYDTEAEKYILVDNESHPELFTDEDGNIGGDLHWSAIDDKYDRNFERLKYSQILKIKNDCNLNVDFEIENYFDRDGYYEGTLIRYKAIDPDYERKKYLYNNRFDIYEKELASYEKQKVEYEEFKLSEKKKKLEEQLNKINSK